MTRLAQHGKDGEPKTETKRDKQDIDPKRKSKTTMKPQGTHKFRDEEDVGNGGEDLAACGQKFF